MHPFFQDFNFYGFVHRGGDEVETENTLEAFEYSSNLGFIFIETDVQSTKDGHVVIFHDSTLKRMAGIDKRISDLTLEEIKKIELSFLATLFRLLNKPMVTGQFSNYSSSKLTNIFIHTSTHYLHPNLCR